MSLPAGLALRALSAPPVPQRSLPAGWGRARDAQDQRSYATANARVLSWRSRSLAVRLPGGPKPGNSAASKARHAGVPTVAMVNVDLGPSTILGTSLVLASLSLWQVRSSKPELSRDMDVVLSSMGVVVGGILIFQGWRLDPLLLFGQLLTVTAAVAFAVETFNLRAQLPQSQTEYYEEDYSRSRPLPPPQSSYSESWNDTFGSDLKGAGRDEYDGRKFDSYADEDRWAAGPPPAWSEQRGGGAEGGRPGRDARGGAQEAQDAGRRGDRGWARRDVDTLDDWDT
eukprot:jgi/Tetstr1/436183/TSEL_025028.t1